MVNTSVEAREKSCSTGMIIRESDPLNLEAPFAALDGLITPTDQFYVRSHFPVPQVKVADWRLRVEGAVKKPVELTLDDLRKMKSKRQIVTLECAGNARIFLAPQVPGAQWGLGAVSTAEWTGVRLSDILERAGVKPGAVDVVLEGADQGKPKEPPIPPEKIRYSRSLPLAKVDEDALLAYEMNGAPLTAPHGFPLRAVVQDWFGMSSVKWLSRIVVIEEAFQGYFQTIDYAYWVQQNGIPVRVPITEMQVKAQIARPAPHEIVGRDTDYRISGAAWGGASAVTRVEVSVDGGKTFAEAELLGKPVPHAWRLWQHKWHTPFGPGPCTLVARATDASGHVQPAERDAHWGSYVICHTLGMEVEVR
jgi:DMSO/TMAO reductase YedYZ molybdopterin-dependent catalytic subunit